MKRAKKYIHLDDESRFKKLQDLRFTNKRAPNEKQDKGDEKKRMIEDRWRDDIDRRRRNH